MLKVINLESGMSYVKEALRRLDEGLSMCKKEGSAKHTICKGISNALNYNLATEVMKIIVGREGEDLLIIGALLILKAMITTLFMLEIKQDELQEKHIENLHKGKKK